MTSLSAIAIALQCTYIVAMDWIHIPGWNNNIKSEAIKPRLISSVWHGGLGILFVIAQLCRIRWLMVGGAIWFTILLLLELNNWWAPYLLGIFKNEISKDAFQKHYTTNYSFLPPIKDHIVVPDAQHIVMETMTLIAITISWMSVFST